MPGRQVSAAPVQAARLRARRAQRAEGLPRRRRSFPAAVRTFNVQKFCGKSDCRHISAVLGERAGLRDPIVLHNFYVPAGGDVPDPAVNPKFAHKLSFLDEMRDCASMRPGASARAILVGDLNVAPLEHDVWSHKQMLRVVSHTPIECDKLVAVQKSGGWVDAMRMLMPEPTKLYTWWSYRSPDWATADKGRRLDHVWVAPALADRVGKMQVLTGSRGWERPSDPRPGHGAIEPVDAFAQRPLTIIPIRAHRARCAPHRYRARPDRCAWPRNRAAAWPRRDSLRASSGTGCAECATRSKARARCASPGRSGLGEQRKLAEKRAGSDASPPVGRSALRPQP